MAPVGMALATGSAMKHWTLLTLLLGVCISGAGAAAAPHGDVSRALSIAAVDTEPPRTNLPSADELQKLEAAIQENPRLRIPRFDWVRALMLSGDWVKAESAVEDWRQHDAYNLVAVRLLGDIQSARGDRERARRSYSAIVELLPREVEARRALATVLKQSGDLEAARQQLRTALELGSLDPRIAFELGDVEQRLGDSEAARARFEAITKASDADETLRYPARQRLGQIHAGERRQAIARGDTRRSKELEQAIAELGLAGGIENDLKIFLSWDSDRTDVDLWVVTPSGEKVAYDHPRGRSGEALYHDVTSGYGPESFTVHRGAVGEYTLQVNFFGARGALKEARGEVIVILNEGRAEETRHVFPYRIFREKDTVTVAKVRIQPGAAR